jgi:hypothetical protein
MICIRYDLASVRETNGKALAPVLNLGRKGHLAGFAIFVE